jgi:hypothetical protein
MNHSPTEPADADVIRLLRAADPDGAADRQAVDAEALVAAASRRRSNSRRKRIAGTAFGAALLSIAISLPGSRSAKPAADKTPSDNGTAELRQTLAALDQEAALRHELVQALQQAERLAARQAELRSLVRASSHSSAADEASRSAAISLQYARLIEYDAHDVEHARQEYERVARRFHGTEWAETAAASLQRLSSSNPSAL